MNDECFFDLAMKVIAGQATDRERAELDVLLAREPAMRAEFARLHEDARLAKDVLPLVDATKAMGDKLPAYARGRLQTKVGQTLGRPAAKRESDRRLAWGWQWILGLAAATAVIVLVALPGLRASSQPTVQLAMLDVAGVTRGADTNESTQLQQSWPAATLASFTSVETLREWESNEKPDSVKIIYDHAAAEVRVVGKWHNKTFKKNFPVETDLATALKKTKSYIAEQTQ